MTQATTLTAQRFLRLQSNEMPPQHSPTATDVDCKFQFIATERNNADGGTNVEFQHIGLTVSVPSDRRPLNGSPELGHRDYGRVVVVGPETIDDFIRSADRPHDVVQNDPVIDRLSVALDAMAARSGGIDSVCFDALRLAMFARLLSIRGTSRSDLPKERSRNALPKWRLQRVVEHVHRFYAGKIALSDLAMASGLSRMHFASQFRKATGTSPHEFILKYRILRAQQLLTETHMPLVQVALEVGFQTQAHFTTVFRRYADDTPYQWRCRHAKPAHGSRERFPTEHS